MTKNQKRKMMKGILAGYEANVDDSLPTRSGPGKGQHGGWNMKTPTRAARGLTPEEWARYQRRVEGVW